MTLFTMTGRWRSTLTTLLLVTLGAATAARAEPLSPVEQQMAATIDERLPRAMSLLEESVNINSGTMNFAGVRKTGEMFGAALRDIGLTTRWIDGEAFGRAGHLIAEYGERGPHLLLIGHLDTVFEPDSPFQRFERLDEHRAKGPGVTDMKGGNVVIVEALAALRAAGILEQMQVTVVLTGDEESAGEPLALARKSLLEAAQAADVALGFEDGDGNPATAVIARRGYSGWQLAVAATAAHSSLIFRDGTGYGAAFETARILDTFRRELAEEEYLTFSAGLVLAGTDVDHDAAHSAGHASGKANVIPERAAVSGDLRTLSTDQERNARQRMRAIVSDSLAGAHAAIEFTDGYPPLAPSDGNRRLLSLYSQASEDLGFGAVEAVDPAAAGAADISFTAGHVDMALDGLGLMGSGGHTVEETADLRTLASQSKRAAVLMNRLRTEL
ncbi:MAG: M20/M25/M40 family metallo-hydrolase [Gammaproteobacteria bacterium]|nr:M20/M25/M40 family metallo-hydrolase [Gammaproteobacteria bacterium]